MHCVALSAPSPPPTTPPIGGQGGGWAGRDRSRGLQVEVRLSIMPRTKRFPPEMSRLVEAVNASLAQGPSVGAGSHHG